MMKTSLFIATPDMPKTFYIHLFTDDIERNVSKAAQLGFDGVELIIGDPDTFDSQRLKKALVDYNMELACINTGRMVIQFGLSLIHPDENVREKAFAKLKSMIDIAGRFGCPLSIGLFRGRALEGKPILHTKTLFAEIMQKACDYAVKLDVGINLEPCNRFELNFINTTEDGLEMIKRVDRTNFGLLMDLYHIYIEETSIEESIMKAKDYVRHFHFSDSDRWPAGVSHGIINFKSVIDQLKTINYNGFLSEGLVPTENIDECARRTAAYLKEIIRACN